MLTCEQSTGMTLTLSPTSTKRARPSPKHTCPLFPTIARGGNPFWMPLPIEPTCYDQSSPYTGGEMGRSVDEYLVFSALAQRVSYLHDQPGSAAVTGMGHGRGAVYLRPTQTSPDLRDIRKNPSRISLSNIIRDQQAGLRVSVESGHRGQQRAETRNSCKSR